MLAWDLVSSHTLFHGINEDGVFDDRVHMAEMIALLGLPPPEFRDRCKSSYVFWDESGNWKDLAPIPDIMLEKLAADFEEEEKEGFLQWLRLALRWNPDDRPIAQELLYDDWMMKGLNSQNPDRTRRFQFWLPGTGGRHARSSNATALSIRCL